MGQTLCVCSRGTVSLGGARYLLLHRLAEGCAAGWGAGGSGGSFPVLREGCSGKGGPRAEGLLERGGDAWARMCLCMGDARAWEVRGPGGACAVGVMGVGGMLGHGSACAWEMIWHWSDAQAWGDA